MAVKDYMTKKVVYVSPDTTVAHATDIMREKDLRRLPVIENDKLVGLVTENTINEASPSKASSLSIYEMNYLLNKTKIRDVMIRDVVTVSPYAELEEAVYEMIQHNVGVLPVVEGDQVYGIITDKDIFKAFLEIAGFGQAGIRISLLSDDSIGVLEKVTDILVSQNLNIKRIVASTRQSGKVAIEIQVEGACDHATLGQAITANGLEVEGIVTTQAKADF